MIQQKIKDFFKPSLKKIVLFILLLLAIPISIFVIADTYSGSPVSPSIIIDIYGNFVLLPFYFYNTFIQGFLSIIPPMMPEIANAFILGLLFLLTIIWWYAIVCFSVLIYNKIKKGDMF